MLMESIRKDMFEAKKVKDKVKANLLSTLFSEIFTESKRGHELTEEDELRIIKKFIKNIDETMALNIPEESRTQFKTEKSILETYLPKQLTKDEVEKIVTDMVAQGKTMKDIMPFFKLNYSGQYDGRMVNEIVKSKTT